MCPSSVTAAMAPNVIRSAMRGGPLASSILLIVAAGACTAGAPSMSTSSPTQPPALLSPFQSPDASRPPIGTALETHPPSPAISPSPVAPPTAPPTETPTALALSDAERSRLFWSRVSDAGYCGGEYQSLADITRRVHLIVIGRVVDAKVDSFLPYEGGGEPIEIMTGIVHVDDALKGTPRDADGTIDVAELAWHGISITELPTEPVLLFLMNEAQQREDGGYSQGDPGADFRYWRPNYFQAALRNVKGKVRVPNPEAPFAHPCGREYPLELNGTSFEAVVGQVQDIVADPDDAYVPDEVLVIFGQHPTYQELNAFIEEYGLRLRARPPPDSRYFRFRIVDGTDPVVKARDVLNEPIVVHATPNWLSESFR